MNKEYQDLIKDGYLNENGVVKIQLIDKQAKELADEFNRCQPALSTKQARSIFNIVNSIYLKMTTQKISVDEAKLQLIMLKSRINDKVLKNSISKEFQSFYDLNMTHIKTEKDIAAFRMHYEAICNYLKDTKPQGRNESFKPKNDNFKSNQGNRSNFSHR